MRLSRHSLPSHFSRAPMLLALPAIALGLLLASCGSGANSTPPAPSSGTTGGVASTSPSPSGGLATVSGGSGVTATANDFNFKFSTNKVSAGTVHFTLDNQSKTYQHELYVFPQNQPKLQDMITALDAGQTVNPSDYLQGIAGHIEPVDPGKSASADMSLQPGTYDMACFVVTSIAGKNMTHYEMGMHGLLTVQ